MMDLADVLYGIEPTDPTFRPRLFGLDRIDARPLIWSMRNKPQDWRMDGSYLMHITAQFRIDIDDAPWQYRFCHEWIGGQMAYFSKLQQFQFHRAYRSWRKIWLSRTFESYAQAAIGAIPDWIMTYRNALDAGAGTIVISREHAEELIKHRMGIG